LRRSLFRVSAGKRLPKVLAHPATLLPVSIDLVSNAVKFVAPDVQPQVRVRAECEGEGIYLWIEDKGIGIALKNRERIFGLFDRLHSR